jgi:hypothetical protein
MGAAGLEQPVQLPEKPGMRPEGGAQCGALRGEALARALILISNLPLSDVEKAEAVRQLLALRSTSATSTPMATPLAVDGPSPR